MKRLCKLFMLICCAECIGTSTASAAVSPRTTSLRQKTQQTQKLSRKQFVAQRLLQKQQQQKLEQRRMRRMLERKLEDPQVRAFLDMIAYAEGTDYLGAAAYAALFTHSLFSGFDRHPNQTIKARSRGNTIYSTAAGRYQFLYKTWLRIAKRAGIHDFSPHSQNVGAAYLLYQDRALIDLDNGRIEQAIKKVRREWSSLPGSGRGQPEKKMWQLVDYYQRRITYYSEGGRS